MTIEWETPSTRLQANAPDDQLQIVVEEHPKPDKQFLCRMPTPDWMRLARGTTRQLPDEWLEALRSEEPHGSSSAAPLREQQSLQS